jgi:hypothetical protein
MNVPTPEDPSRYQGLYVFDFGQWSAVGYTAEEIAMLLESEQYRDGKVYRIVRASPDGHMELRGIARERFQTESGMFFSRGELEAAQADFDRLRKLGASGAPCRAFIHLTDRGPHGMGQRYIVALIYPGEYEEEMARWLLDAGHAGGDMAEGGPSHVSNYYSDAGQILARHQLWSQSTVQSRSADEVYASVRRAIQR